VEDLELGAKIRRADERGPNGDLQPGCIRFWVGVLVLIHHRFPCTCPRWSSYHHLTKRFKAHRGGIGGKIGSSDPFFQSHVCPGGWPPCQSSVSVSSPSCMTCSSASVSSSGSVMNCGKCRTCPFITPIVSDTSAHSFSRIPLNSFVQLHNCDQLLPQ
jgi:hypothetical protein